MTSTFTSNKSFEEPGYNDYVDSWNVPMNANFTTVDTAMGGSTLLNATGSSGTVSLTSTQYRPLSLIISGSPTGALVYSIPSGVGGQWTVTNNTAGTYPISIVSAAGGSSVPLRAGYSTIVSCDGSSSGMRLSINTPAQAAGSNNQIQINSSGVLGASSNLSFDGTTLSVTGNDSVSGNSTIGGLFSVGGDTSSAGNVSIGKSNPTLTLNKTASGQYNYISGSTSNSLRWQLNLGNSEAESGANAGSNFSLRRFDDSGTLIGSALTVNRATGAATFSGDASVGGNASVTGNLSVTGTISSPSASFVPTGSMMAFAGSSTPSGWLLCAGQQVSTTTYAALYAVISTTYGSGPGTFGIPDLRGRIPAGKDDMGGSAASRITSASSISGATLGASGGDQLQQSHAHSVSISDPGHTHAPQSGTSFWGNSGSSGGGQPTGGGFSTVGGVTASSTTGITATAGNSGSGYSQNMPPVIIANYIIKF